jgi:hypothetical protein
MSGDKLYSIINSRRKSLTNLMILKDELYMNVPLLDVTIKHPSVKTRLIKKLLFFSSTWQRPYKLLP